MRSLQTIGEVRLDDRKFGIFRRSARSWPARRRSTNGGGSSGSSKTPNRTRLGWKRAAIWGMLVKGEETSGAQSKVVHMTKTELQTEIDQNLEFFLEKLPEL